MATWHSSAAASGDDGSIQARLFGSDGAPVGDDVQVSTTPTITNDEPDVALGIDGELLVAWPSSTPVGDDTDEDNVQARVLDIAFDIAGQAWLDSDLDGLRDAGESALQDVSVHLFTAGGAMVDSTMTDAAGSYSFANRIGNHFVEFQAPMEYSFTPQDNGEDDSIDSDVDPANGQTPVFSASGQTAWDAGLGNGIGDRVWLDEVRNGIQDDSEPGFPGIQVELINDTGNPIFTTVTDDEGRYVFSDLVAGTYTVRVTAPEGFDFTDQGQGGDGTLDSDVDFETGQTLNISFANGEVNVDIDAGLKGSSFFEDGFESGDVSAWSSSVP